MGVRQRNVDRRRHLLAQKLIKLPVEGGFPDIMVKKIEKLPQNRIVLLKTAQTAVYRKGLNFPANRPTKTAQSAGNRPIGGKPPNLATLKSE